MMRKLTTPVAAVGRGARGLFAQRRLLAGIAAILAGGAFGGAALAASPYTVKLSVPSLVNGVHFKAKATGSSSKTSHLRVFIASKCAANPKAEAAVTSARQIISKNVVHSFTATKTTVAGASGVHHVCAYLTAPSGSSVRAHAGTTYTALTGGY